jgi:alkylation response protein AidB-like acyl-CoA dehydrogenase
VDLHRRRQLGAAITDSAPEQFLRLSQPVLHGLLVDEEPLGGGDLVLALGEVGPQRLRSRTATASPPASGPSSTRASSRARDSSAHRTDRSATSRCSPETILDELSAAELAAIARPLQEEAKQRGLWTAHLPPELGGRGFGQLKLALIHEILGKTVMAPTVFGDQAPDSGNGEILALAGTEDQKQRFLHPLLDGQLRSAFSMTEPEVAGSDPTQIRTRARRQRDHYVINGHKWFSSNAPRADFLIVMAVTDPDAAPHQRASMFIVPADTPGVNIVRDVPTMEFPAGTHDAFHGGHAEIVYEDVRVPAALLLGGEGEGFRIAQQRLGPGRVHHCMRFIGTSQRAFDMLCRRVHGALGFSTDLPLEATHPTRPTRPRTSVRTAPGTGTRIRRTCRSGTGSGPEPSSPREASARDRLERGMGRAIVERLHEEASRWWPRTGASRPASSSTWPRTRFPMARSMTSTSARLMQESSTSCHPRTG